MGLLLQREARRGRRGEGDRGRERSNTFRVLWVKTAQPPGPEVLTWP